MCGASKVYISRVLSSLNCRNTKAALPHGRFCCDSAFDLTSGVVLQPFDARAIELQGYGTQIGLSFLDISLICTSYNSQVLS